MKLLLAMVSAVAVSAQAQQIANTWTNLTTPTMIAGAATSNLVSQPIYVNPGYGVSVQIALRGAAGDETTTSNVTYRVNVSIDGTNWLSTAPYAGVIALNGTNSVIGGTNFPGYLFDGFARARLESIVNESTNDIIIDSVKVGRARQRFVYPD